MTFKKSFYIFCFSLFGGMIGFLLHAFIEAPILAMLIKSTTGTFAGMGYDQWVLVHVIGTPFLSIVGVLFGFLQGQYWWKELYVKTHHRW